MNSVVLTPTSARKRSHQSENFMSMTGDVKKYRKSRRRLWGRGGLILVLKAILSCLKPVLTNLWQLADNAQIANKTVYADRCAKFAWSSTAMSASHSQWLISDAQSVTNWHNFPSQLKATDVISASYPQPWSEPRCLTITNAIMEFAGCAWRECLFFKTQSPFWNTIQISARRPARGISTLCLNILTEKNTN